MENSYIVPETTLTEIADAIREKTGSTDTIAIEDFASNIKDVQGGTSLLSPMIRVNIGYAASANSAKIIGYIDNLGNIQCTSSGHTIETYNGYIIFLHVSAYVDKMQPNGNFNIIANDVSVFQSPIIVQFLDNNGSITFPSAGGAD